MKQILTAFIFMSIISCSNDSNTTEVGRYTVEPNPYEISEIKILTNQGEVSNDTLITFLRQTGTIQNPDDYLLYKDLKGTLYSNQTIETTYFNRNQIREISDFTNYEIWENTEYLNTVFRPYDMFKYQRPNYRKIIDENHPNDDSYSTEEYRDCIFLEKNELESYLPMTIAIYITRPNLSTRKTIQYHENNVFEPNFISTMSESDTIVVQSYRLKIIRD